MLKKKRIPFWLAAAVIIWALSACTGSGAPGKEETTQTKESVRQAESTSRETSATSGNEKQESYLGTGTVGDKWYASVIAGAVSEETEVSLKDDFFTAVNLDYLAKLTIEDGYSSAGVFQDANKIMRERTLALLKEENPASHEGQLVSNLYKLALDWEKRKEEGLKPITAEVESIKNIRTIDDVAAYETRGDNMFSPLLTIFLVTDSMADPGNYTVGINSTALFLEDPGEYSNQSEDGKLTEEYSRKVVGYMLDRLGFSGEEADKVWSDCRAFETAVAEHMLTLEDQYSPDIYDRIINTCTLEDLRKAQGNYPLVEILKAYGMDESDTYNLYEPEWLSALGNLYTEEHVEEIRSYLLAHYLFDMALLIDRDAYDTVKGYENERNGITGTIPEEEIGLEVVNDNLSMAMDYVYIDAHCTEEERQKVIDLIHDFSSYYRKMLEQEDWLSQNTKQRAMEKLDNLTIRACYSDTREDYSQLAFASKEEGGTYIEALQAIRRHVLQTEQEKINQKVNPDLWQMSTREINAYYSPTDNSINILCGILVGDLSMDQSDEAVLATAGQVIGHEITHAFDTSGAQFDKNGNYNNWWEEADYAAFNERADRLVEYMNQIIPCAELQPVNGEMQKTEMIADMGGMKAALMMAADQQNFDYDVFFRSASKVWAMIRTKNRLISQQQTDPHPLSNLRVNIPLQHSDEFMETYDIQPGDGMYLAPEDRVNVW